MQTLETPAFDLFRVPILHHQIIMSVTVDRVVWPFYSCLKCHQREAGVKKKINSRSAEVQTLETPAFDLFRVPILHHQLIDKTKLSCYTLHRCSTTVSVETHPLYSFVVEIDVLNYTISRHETNQTYRTRCGPL